MRFLRGFGYMLIIAAMGCSIFYYGEGKNPLITGLLLVGVVALAIEERSCTAEHKSELEQLSRINRGFLEQLMTNHLNLKQPKPAMTDADLRALIIAAVEELKRMEPLCRAAQRHLGLLTDICVFLRFSNELTSDEAKQLRRMLACLITELADADKRAKDELNLGLDLDSQHDSILQLEAQKAALFDVYARLSLGKHLRDDRPRRQWEQTLDLAIARYLSGWRPPKGEDVKRIAAVRWERLMRDEVIKIAIQDSVVMPEEEAIATEPMTDAR